MGLFNGPGSIGEFFTNPAQWWDYFKNGRTNAVNQEMNTANLLYQMQRNIIEDARYDEEMDYNRAFAEDERAYSRAFAEDERSYNRALQQEIFNREDTALERQASSLSSMGINPLSQQLNGLGSGNVVSTSTPSPTTEPSMSARGGQALHNDFKMQDTGIINALGALSGLADTMNGISTGQYQRDSLQLENDRKYLENLDYANQLGINYTTGLDWNNNYRKSHGKRLNLTDSFGNSTPWSFTPYAQYSQEAAFDKVFGEHREFMHKKNNDLYDYDDPHTRLIKNLSNLDFTKIAENILTQSAKFSDNLQNFKNNDDFKKSPIMKFFSLFF